MKTLEWLVRATTAVALGVYIAAAAWHATLKPNDDPAPLMTSGVAHAE